MNSDRMIFVETMFCGCNEGGAGYRCSYRILYGINLANVPNALSCTQALHDSATGIFPGDPLASNATRTQTM